MCYAFDAITVFFGNATKISELESKKLYFFTGKNHTYPFLRYLGGAQLANIGGNPSEEMHKINSITSTSDRAKENIEKIIKALYTKRGQVADIIFEYGPKDMAERFKIFTNLMQRIRNFNDKKVINPLEDKILFTSAVLHSHYSSHCLFDGTDFDNNPKIKIIVGNNGDLNDKEQAEAEALIAQLAGYGIKSVTNGMHKQILKGQPSMRENENLRYIVLEDDQFNTLFENIMSHQKDHEHSNRYDASLLWFALYSVSKLFYQFAETFMYGMSYAYNCVCSFFLVSENAVNNVTQEQQEQNSTGRGG